MSKRLGAWIGVIGRIGLSVPLLLAGCGEGAVSLLQQSVAVYDGAHNGGNEHFYFLPPLVKGASYSGEFDPTLAPQVEICAAADATADGGCDSSSEPLVASFSMTSGAGAEIIRMEPGEEHYIVNWRTDQSDLTVGATYRIAVTVGSEVVGYAEVQVAATGKEMKNVDTDEAIALKDGRTLAISFRIEQGAVSAPAVSRALASGSYHSCALSGGRPYCWGYNFYGELGIGTFSWGGVTVPTAVQLPAGLTFTALALGSFHSCALDSDGYAWCWGYGYAGQLGNGSMTYRQATPVKVAGGPFVSISSKTYHTCGLKRDGTAWCWGSNQYGQLGTGSTNRFGVATPARAAPGTTFTALEVGGVHTCGLKADGTALCWGDNCNGMLGSGYVSPYPYCEVLTPVAVAGGHTFAALSLGPFSSCGVTSDSSAYCWGYNRSGELGSGSATTDVTKYYSEPTPTPVAGGLSFAQMSLGDGHSCGLTTGNVGYCWGANRYGQLGTGSASTSSPWNIATPQAVAAGSALAAIAAGHSFTCATTTSGEARCWGANPIGQLGDGTVNDDPAPTHPVAGGLTFDTP